MSDIADRAEQHIDEILVGSIIARDFNALVVETRELERKMAALRVVFAELFEKADGLMDVHLPNGWKSNSFKALLGRSLFVLSQTERAARAYEASIRKQVWEEALKVASDDYLGSLPNEIIRVIRKKIQEIPNAY